MNSVRNWFGWLFAITSVVCIRIAFRLSPQVMQHRPYNLHFIESITIFPVEAIIFAMAWWFVWKRKHSARFVGIAASLTLLVNTLIAYLQFPHLFWSVRTIAIAALGILGVIAFILPDQAETTIERF
jgi:hypothetical protein